MKILVAGGGAAGFMAAITAAQQSPDHHVVIAEKSNQTLSKVLISGGGRCNVTHQPLDFVEFSGNYPRGSRFIKKILHEFGPEDTIKWFEQKGVKLKVESDGRVFPVSDKSESIIRCLRDQAAKYRIQIRHKYNFICCEFKSGSWEVTFNDDTTEHYDRIILAMGGFHKSVAYDVFRGMGLKVNEPVPSLFTFNSPTNPITELQGISVPQARIRIEGSKLDWCGPLLITHWGFSGPAVLKLSAWGARWLAERKYEFIIYINWVANISESELRALWIGLRDSKSQATIGNYSGIAMPSRLWKYLITNSGINLESRWAELSNKAIESLINTVIRQPHKISGKTTFKEEFVTCGGIDLSEINHQTMECKKLPGIYIVGELLDIDGITGGFNFQNAWTTGYIAGKSAGSL